MVDLFTKAGELKEYLEALNAGRNAIQQGQNPPPDPPPLDVPAYKTSFRNKVIAGSSFKAKFYGTLTTKPKVTADTLKFLGMTAAAANAVIAERDKIRSGALELIQ